MPIRSLVFALACLAAPALAFAAKWEKVGDAGPVAVYVDKESVRRSGLIDPRRPSVTQSSARRSAAR